MWGPSSERVRASSGWGLSSRWQYLPSPSELGVEYPSQLGGTQVESDVESIIHESFSENFESALKGAVKSSTKSEEHKNAEK